MVSYEGIETHLEVTYVSFFRWNLGQVTLSTYAQHNKGKLRQHYAKAWMFSICHCVFYQYRFGGVQKSCWCWFHAYMCIIYPYITCTIVLDTLFVGSKDNWNTMIRRHNQHAQGKDIITCFKQIHNGCFFLDWKTFKKSYCIHHGIDIKDGVINVNKCHQMSSP